LSFPHITIIYFEFDFRFRLVVVKYSMLRMLFILVFDINFSTMPYTKEEIEDKLRKALDASYVVRFIMR